MSLYRDADQADVLENPQLGDRHLYCRRLEFVEYYVRHALGERLDEVHVLRGDLADARGHLVVVDAVGDLVAREDRAVGDADLEVDADRLRHHALAPVKADERLQAEVPDEDVVHGRGDYRRG